MVTLPIPSSEDFKFARGLLIKLGCNAIRSGGAYSGDEPTLDSGFKGQYLGDALPQLPKWTVTGFQWAPSVWADPNGTYVMYYSTPATIPLICLAKPSSPGMYPQQHERTHQCNVHLEGNELQPDRTLCR